MTTASCKKRFGKLSSSRKRAPSKSILLERALVVRGWRVAEFPDFWYKWQKVIVGSSELSWLLRERTTSCAVYNDFRHQSIWVFAEKGAILFWNRNTRSTQRTVPWRSVRTNMRWTYARTTTLVQQLWYRLVSYCGGHVSTYQVGDKSLLSDIEDWRIWDVEKCRLFI